MILPMANGIDMDIPDDMIRNRKAHDSVLSSGIAILSNLQTSFLPPDFEGPSLLNFAERFSWAACEAFSERLKDCGSSASSSFKRLWLSLSAAWPSLTSVGTGFASLRHVDCVKALYAACAIRGDATVCAGIRNERAKGMPAKRRMLGEFEHDEVVVKRDRASMLMVVM